MTRPRVGRNERESGGGWKRMGRNNEGDTKEWGRREGRVEQRRNEEERIRYVRLDRRKGGFES